MAKLASQRAYVIKAMPLSQDTRDNAEAFVATSRTARVAGTRRLARPNRRPIATPNGMQLSLFDQPIATTDSDNTANVAVDVEDNNHEDNTDTPPALPTPVKPRPPQPTLPQLTLNAISTPGHKNENKTPLIVYSPTPTEPSLSVASAATALDWPVFAGANTGMGMANAVVDHADQWTPAQFGQPKYGRNYAAYDHGSTNRNHGFSKAPVRTLRRHNRTSTDYGAASYVDGRYGVRDRPQGLLFILLAPPHQ